MTIVYNGRGATLNMPGRFETVAAATECHALGERPPTKVLADRSRTIIATNDSPDVGFDRSINPYRGCEHGCIYCYARPTHAYLGLSPGLDFETRLFAKHDAAARLEETFRRRGYRPTPLQLGGVTDGFQPIERELKITRGVLSVLLAWRHPVQIVTKSASIVRDVDILSELAALGLVRVELSLTTLDARLARTMEPRAATPTRRLEAMQVLARAGVPVGVATSPIIPGLTCHEIERLLRAAADVGATTASYVLLRLPYELKALFEDWLAVHYPDRRRRVLSLVRQSRGGQLNDPQFTSRMRGAGPVAELIGQRFAKACARYGLTRRDAAHLRTDLFGAPGAQRQPDLFADATEVAQENS